MKEIDEKDNVPVAVVKRPFMLSIFIVFSSVYFFILASLFLLSVFYSGNITSFINIYVPEKVISETALTLLFLAGFLLHVCALTGLVMLWKMNRSGYYLFAISSLIIAGYHLIQPSITPLSTLVYIVLIVMLGLFFRKLK